MGRRKERFPVLHHALLSLAALCTAGGAQAEGIKLSGELAAVSDYRFRGYSLSDGQPALQGGMTLTDPSGFYANTWASTINEYGTGASGRGATVELDLGVGLAFSIGAYDFHVAAVAYTYPGGHDVNFVEIPISASHTVGAWAWTLGAAYAPPLFNLGNKANTYVYGSVALAPMTWPIRLEATLGQEDGVFADRKTDWSLAVSKSFGPISVSMRYVGTDAPGVHATAVGSLGMAF
jgi:uncharacterized protein (TIGR02001 family)